MSAYICNPQHIGLVAALCVQYDTPLPEFRNHASPVLSAQLIARELARENIRSVACRYPNDKDGERPGPCLKDAEIVEGAALYAGHFIKHPVRNVPVIHLISFLRCLDYQSDQCEDYEQRAAKKQITRLLHTLISELPGYSEAPWEYNGTAPQIEALIWPEVTT